MDNRPIGVFDSGLGGLTALKVLREILSDENYIYFGDSARAPYGCKSPSELAVLARQCTDFLLSHNVKAILAACGTCCTNAPDVLRSLPVPCLGVIEPAVRTLSSVEGSAPLAVIATEATVRSGVYSKGISALAPGRELIELPCQDFVPLIEAGHSDERDPLLIEAVSRLLEPVKRSGAEALLLACTHFGIIAPAISAYLGEGVRIVSASQCGAEALADCLRKNEMHGTGGSLLCCTSGDSELFRANARSIMGEDLNCTHINLMEVICV